MSVLSVLSADGVPILDAPWLGCVVTGVPLDASVLPAEDKLLGDEFCGGLLVDSREDVSSPLSADEVDVAVAG